jgi:aspartate-semialdehyde dehydrogenase
MGAPVVSVLRALAALAPVRATIVTHESAAVRGQAGMDELSEGVRARFNMREVEPKIFPGAIAFGVLPEEEDGALREAITAGVKESLPDLQLFLMRNIVPTFSADSASVIVELGDRETMPDPDRVKSLLEAAKGVHLVDDDESASSFDAVGRDDVLAARITVEEGRAGVWLACDRLRRGSATLAALAIERWAAS